MSAVLSVENMSTRLQLSESTLNAVTNVSFDLAAGELLGIVGESGSGKSMMGLSLMGLLPSGGSIVEGSVKLNGRDLAKLSEREMQKVRGNDIAMVFQDSLSSLNPTKTIGDQVAETVMVHRNVSKKEALERAAEVLSLVGLPHPRERLGEYPHQLSGGLRQRVMIAIALACDPKVLIADEPTTALDVTVQAQILELLDDLRERQGMGVILVTHDMGVVAGRADRVAVMYSGQIVETASTEVLFDGMRHPYTQALLGSIPRLESDPRKALITIPGTPPALDNLPGGCRFAARCRFATEQCRAEEPPMIGAEEHRFMCWHPVDGPVAANIGIAHPDLAQSDRELPILRASNLVKEFVVTKGALRRRIGTVKAVSKVSLDVYQGETLGIVGESGCGKSSLGRLLVGLEAPDDGTISIQGEEIFRQKGRALRKSRRDVQMMFQDPYSSLDPRMRVGEILREPLQIQGIGSRRDQDERIRLALDDVGLPEAVVERYPHEFSGGQRQRIGLARTLLLEPKLMVADEPVSALDVSVRSQVLNMMKRLQAERGMASIVISHDMAVVKYLADRIAVMYLGKIVEIGSADDIYENVAHPYTSALLKAVPEPDPDREKAKTEVALVGEMPSPINPPSGCRFRTRCPFATEKCAEQEPVLSPVSETHVVACHYPLTEGTAARPAAA